MLVSISILHHHAGGRFGAGCARERDLTEVKRVLVNGAHLISHERVQIHRTDLALAIGKRLEPRKHFVQLCLVELISHVDQRLAQRVSPGVLPQHQFTLHQSYALGVHDLVGERVGEHSVLMDTGLMREGITPDHGLVGLDVVPGEAAHHATGACDLSGLDPRPQPAEVLCPGAQDHGHLFERGVTRALADAVNAHLHLSSAHLDAREGVGHSQSQIVVTMHRECHALKRGAALVQIAEKVLELGGHRVPDGVRNVDGLRALCNCRANNLGHERRVGSGCVLA